MSSAVVIPIIVVMFVLMGLGTPIFIAMGAAGLAGLFLFFGGIHQALIDFPSFVWQGLNTFELVAIPMFVLTGMLIREAKMGDDLFNFAKAWFGSVTNGLGVGVILACAMFAAISGSSPVTAVTIGLIALPALAREGYPDHIRGTVVAAGGTLGIMFPPSIPLIIYGVITQTSIGELFIGSLIPGIVLTILMGLYLGFVVRPKIRTVDYTWAQRRLYLRRAAGILVLPIFIVVSIYTGLITPSETGAVTALYVLALGIIQRRFTVQKVINGIMSGALTSSMLLMIFGLGTFFARYTTVLQLPQDLATAVTHVGGGPFLIFTAMVIAYIIMGTFLESGAMTILTIPIFFPIAMAIGLNPIQFGIMAAANQEIAQIHPPAGLNLVTVSSISKIPLTKMMGSILPYIAIEVGFLYLLYFVPILTEFLPAHMFHG